MTEPCQRRAWLTLGSLSVDLEDYSGGWFCQSLDLGYPEVRDVTSNRPDQSGIDDRTAYFGGRTVDAQITALSGAGATIDAVAATFAPFMDPAARPTLHYVLDRPGHPERVLTTLRAAGYAWPVVGPYQRDIQLQWVAADPVIYDPVQKTSTSWSGSSTAPGRVYNWTPNRIYPPGGSSPTVGGLSTAGDLPMRPLFRIYGPITAPVVQVQISGLVAYQLFFLGSVVIPAGQWVDVDCRTKTVILNSDPSQSWAANLDWQNSTWPVIQPGILAGMWLRGSSTSGITQVQAFWQDGYLT